MSKTQLLIACTCFCLFAACGPNQAEVAETFLKEYSTQYQKLYLASGEAEWKSNTHIVEGDSTNDLATRKANEALAAYQGSKEVIEKCRELLKHERVLSPMQVKQIRKILYMAAANPATVDDLVKAKIKAQTDQTAKMYGFTFTLGADTLTPNLIDNALKDETDVAKRQKMWEASKAVGTVLKDGLVNLRNLRNQTVQALDYPDYFTYQVSDYNMKREEMMKMCEDLVKEVWPLYRELHTWARHELAKKYKEEVPEMLPAHWLPNKWGQDWAALVDVKGFDLDAVIKEKGVDWVVKQSEKFYISLGFPALPEVFWQKSDLLPLAPGSTFKKNTHASAWHLDLDKQVRCLMGVEPNGEWYETTHHEYGHIYYFLEYSNPEIPIVLREGANRAYHEAFGSMMGLAAMQKPFLEGIGLVDKNVKTDEIQTLLKEALSYIVLLPWACGTMTHFEHDLYATNLVPDQFNARWWEIVKKYQGIVPPTTRGEEFCDAATKTHINDDPAQYYDYGLSFVQLFQMHDHIAKNILKQEPRNTNYFGSKETGDFLKGMMKYGATRDWRELYKEKVGADLSAKPMLEYFSPLTDYLKRENEGRTHTLPENL